VITCHSREIGKYIIGTSTMSLSHGININNNWRLGRMGWMDLDLVGQQSGALVAFVPSMSIKDSSLHWIP
jgi:hypothetical protein